MPSAPPCRYGSAMPTATSADPRTGSSALDQFFKITERGSSIGREVRGGVVTFFTMAYIVVLNPLILGFAPDANGDFLGGGAGDGSNLPAIAAGTALVAGLLTILMGVVANFPLALATGLGLNAFVAFAVASQMTWADAMGLVVLEGLIILVLVLTGFRAGRLPRRAQAAQGRDLGRASASSSPSSASSTPASCAAPPRAPCPSSSVSTASSAAGRPSSSSSASSSSSCSGSARSAAPSSSPSPRRPCSPSSSRRSPRSARWSSRDKVNPTGWGLIVPTLPDDIIDTPSFSTVGQFSLLGVVPVGRHRLGRAAHLHAHARRLLRHHGHDDGDRPRGRPARRGRPAAQHRPDPRRRLARRRRRWRRGRLVQHELHRVGLGCRRGCAHRPGVGRHRPALPAVDGLRAAHQGRPVRGGRPGPRPRRLPHDAAGQGDRLGRRRDRHPGVPHDRAHAVHVLDHRRHRRRLRRLRAHQGSCAARRPRSTASCGSSPGCSCSTSRSTRSRPPSASDFFSRLIARLERRSAATQLVRNGQ